MGRIIGRFIVIFVVLMAISFFAAPAVAFFGVRSAAEANDVNGLTRLIDFGAVRGSLRPQLSGRSESMAPPPSFLDDPIGAVRRQFEQVQTPDGPNVDAYLTPVALAALTRGEGRFAAERSSQPQPSPDAETTGGPLPRPVFWGVNRARMAVIDEGGSETIFTFERKGLFEWKLVHIGLPEGAAPAPAPPAPAAPAATS